MLNSTAPVQQQREYTHDLTVRYSSIRVGRLDSPLSTLHSIFFRLSFPDFTACGVRDRRCTARFLWGEIGGWHRAPGPLAVLDEGPCVARACGSRMGKPLSLSLSLVGRCGTRKVAVYVWLFEAARSSYFSFPSLPPRPFSSCEAHDPPVKIPPPLFVNDKNRTLCRIFSCCACIPLQNPWEARHIDFRERLEAPLPDIWRKSARLISYRVDSRSLPNLLRR